MLRILLTRMLFPERASILTLALWICVGGVALGIVQLMLVLSVFSGFQGFLQDKYTRITSRMVVIPPRGEEQRPEFEKALGQIPHVEATTPFLLGQGMLIKDGSVGGVVLEGIDLKRSDEVMPWSDVCIEGPIDAKPGEKWMWIGSQLAKKMGVSVGDTVNVMLAEGQRKRILSFRVTALTRFGIYDHDLRYARVDINELRGLFGFGNREPLYKLKITEGGGTEREDAVYASVLQSLGPRVTVKPWHEINRNVFLAVQHQKQMLFWVLEILVALAAINVINLLMMSGQHRRRDIAILRAMGMRFHHVFLLFLCQGMLVGLMGIVLGVSLGYATCALVERYQPEILSEAVYNVTRLPIRVETSDVGFLCLVAFGVCVIFSVLPAVKAAYQRPVEALRYE